MRPRLAVCVLLSVTALSACGGRSSTPASPSPTEASASTSASTSVASEPPSPLPTLEPPEAPPSIPSDSFQEATVSGTVRLDGDCTTLTDDNGVVWDLRGSLAAPLATGELVTVTGRSLDDPDDPCPGAPLQVSRVG